MHLSTGEVEDEPTVNRAEAQLSPARSFTCSFNVVKYPLELCSGKICINEQTSAAAYILAQLAAFYLIAILCGTAALPYYCITDRLTGSALPHNSGLTLICNSDPVNIRSVSSRL